MPTIDYFFVSASPFAYLGHKVFHQIAAKHEVKINYRPVRLLDVWEKSGSLPLGQRTPARQRYRRIELQRFAEQRDIMLNLDPKFFPVDTSVADRAVVALVLRGDDPNSFLWRVHNGLWALDENIGDPKVLADYLNAENHDAAAVLELAASDEAGTVLSENTTAAIAVDAVGAPTYVLNGEPFWGQDRLDLLDRALEKGRRPFKG